jgi:hypothetical protein
MCTQMYSLAETPQLPPPPSFGLVYGGTLLVSKDGRQLFVTPCLGIIKADPKLHASGGLV